MTKPVEEPPVIPIITEPRKTLDRLQTVTNTLGQASGALREVLRPLDRQTLDGEQERLRIFGSQQPPGWAASRIAQVATNVATYVEQFVEQYEAAQEVLVEIRPQLQATVDHLTERRAGSGTGTFSEVELLNDFEDQITKIQRAVGDLDSVITRAGTWIPVAKASALRTAEAAGRAISAQLVLDLTVGLKAMSDRVQAMRSATSPALGEVLKAITKAERLNETHIRLPEIIWPTDGDLFSPPSLREWGSD